MRQKLSEWRECKLWREGNSWILRSGVGWDGRFSVFLSPFSSFRALSCRSRTITRGVVKVYRSRRSECFQCLIRTFIDIYGPIWLAARSVKEPKWSINATPTPTPPPWLSLFWSMGTPPRVYSSSQRLRSCFFVFDEWDKSESSLLPDTSYIDPTETWARLRWNCPLRLSLTAKGKLRWRCLHICHSISLPLYLR